MEGARTWNTEVRAPWNPVIKHCLIAIDLHMALYLESHDTIHLTQANSLREYVRVLKTWILHQEGLE